MFMPTQEQEDVRTRARMLYDNGYRLVGQWVNRIPFFTVGKFRSWVVIDGFWGWWTELFPEHLGVTSEDVKALEFEAMNTLMRAICDGDVAAVNMVLKLVHAKSLLQKQESVDEGFDDWFEPKGKMWLEVDKK